MRIGVVRNKNGVSVISTNVEQLYIYAAKYDNDIAIFTSFIALLYLWIP